MAPSKQDIELFFRDLQDEICHALEAADGEGQFREDLWERPGGGGGRTRILEGKHIEKGGVNFSAVHGTLSPKASQKLQLDGEAFFASGVSIVLHPRNPWVPIIHMNVRYFEMDSGAWWFGGGIDLTPHYIQPEQAAWFHQQLKAVCDRFDPNYYPKFKDWADRYFYLPHREETRGVGGIFFDRLQADKAHTFGFVQGVGEAFAPIYVQLLDDNQARSYATDQVEWQRYRRGRYVEFNLVWDQGTRFGLETNGRTESILMSLPPLARWEYDLQPKAGSPEAETQRLLQKGIDWINYNAPQ